MLKQIVIAALALSVSGFAPQRVAFVAQRASPSSALFAEKAEVEERVKAFMVEKFDVAEDKLTPEADFIEDLGFDSLDTVEMIMDMEEQFDCEIPEEEVASISKFEDLVTYLADKI